MLWRHTGLEVGQEALESSSAELQSAAKPSQLPTQIYPPTKKPDVCVTPGFGGISRMILRVTIAEREQVDSIHCRTDLIASRSPHPDSAGPGVWIQVVRIGTSLDSHWLFGFIPPVDSHRPLGQLDACGLKRFTTI